MKKGRVLKRTLSVILAALVILEILPFTVFASAIDKYNHALEVQPEPSTQEKAPILHEVEELREENIKVYQRADGTYSAFVSSAPIHYLESNEWKDIDNTLVTKNIDSKTVLTNEDNSCQVQIPAELSSNSEIVLKNDNSQISFSMKDISASDGKVNNNISAEPAEELARLASIENKDSSVTFKNVKPDTDVEYIMGATSLKENIVINQKPSSVVDFTYELNTDGLTAVLNSDSSISIYSGSETVYLIESPYMLDSASNYSGDVYVSLDSLGGGKYQITYTPDFSFLSNEATVYPVTVDPTVNFYRKRNLNEACYGSYTAPNGSDNTKEWFIQNFDSNNSEIYYRLPEGNFAISQNVVIKSAVLSAFCSDVGDDDANKNVVSARAITEEWAGDTTSLLNKSEDVLDYNVIKAGDAAKRYSWDVTQAAAMWALGQSDNFGIALGSYGSGRCNVKVNKGENVYSNQMPWLVIDYEKTSDSRDKFNFASVDMGRAGTVNFNTHNGTLYLERNDLSLSGNLLPVATGSVYNPWSELDYNTNSSGAYWHNTYFLRLLNGGTVSETVDGTAYTRRVLKLAEGDTLVKEYQETSETDSDGLVKYKCLSDDSSYTLYADSSLNSTLDFSKVTVVENESGNKLSFTSNGKLNKITDKYSNQNTIEYSGDSSYTITKITDGAGRAYIYSTVSVAGYPKIGTLKVANSAGNTIKLGGEDFKITYSYTSTGAKSVANLTSVTYPDGESVSYEYTNGNILNAVENIDGSRLEISYANGRVSGYRKYVGAHKLESGMDISYDSALQRTYSYYKTGSSQPYKTETVRYGSDLKEISKVSNDGSFSFSNYDSQGELTSDAYTKEPSESELIANGDFASSASWSSVPVGAGSVVDTEAMGRRTAENAKCFKLGGTYNSNARVYQTVNNLTVGGTYSFGAWAKAAACAGSDKTFGILIEDAESKIIGSYEYNKDYSDWQFGAASFIATTATVKIYLIYDNQPSDAYFDGVTLFKSDSSYVYEELDDTDSDSDFDSDSTSTLPATITVNGTTYRTSPCDSCSCAQCTYANTATYNGEEISVYYNCACDDENSQCDCLGCRQERGRTETKDSKGNVLKNIISDGEKSVVMQNSYTSDGNYLASSIDSNGNIAYYNYNADTSLLDSYGKKSNVANPVVYSYNAMGMLTEVTQTVSNLVGGTAMTSNYAYEHDKIKSISHNGTTYNYEYDEYGNQTAVKVGEQSLVSYGYTSDKSAVNAITYGNGLVIGYTLDENGNIIKIKFNNSDMYSYEYSNGELAASYDYMSMIKTSYNKDGNVSIAPITVSGGTVTAGDAIYSSAVNDNGETVETIFGTAYTYSDSDEKYIAATDETEKTETVFYGNNKTEITTKTDFFGRVTGKTITHYKNGTATMPLENEYVYPTVDLGGDDGNRTYTSVGESHMSYCGSYDLYKYAYTPDGSIRKIYTDAEVLYEYEYDEAGQIKTVYCPTKHIAYTYSYDTNGNITSKVKYTGVEYESLTGATAEKTDTYTYSDSLWSDKLTAYNGQAISYDSIGNPTSYRGATLTWNGRLLMSYEKNGVKYTYTYNESGLRTSKTKYVDNVKKFEETYIWSGNKLAATKKTETANGLTAVISYLYDSNDEVYGFTYNNKTYIYVKTIQGDVSGIINATDNIACIGMLYDAWGNVTYDYNEELDSLGMLEAMNIASINSIAYRGYFYDFETGLYYLQSRYYDPETGRFINADDIYYVAYNGTSISVNLFAYCGNNSVNKRDKTGFLTFKVNYYPSSQNNIWGHADFEFEGTIYSYGTDGKNKNKAYIQFYGATFYRKHLEGRKKGIIVNLKLTDDEIRKMMLFYLAKVACCSVDNDRHGAYVTVGPYSSYNSVTCNCTTLIVDMLTEVLKPFKLFLVGMIVGFDFYTIYLPLNLYRFLASYAKLFGGNVTSYDYT